MSRSEPRRLPAAGRGRADILFVPPITNPVFTNDIERFMPLGLLALAANLRVEGLAAEVFRPDRPLFRFQDYTATAIDIVRRETPIVGFSTWCHSYPTALLLARELKRLRPELHLVFGGPQATLLDVETLERHPSVDVILRGEADQTIAPLVHCLLAGAGPAELAAIPGLSFRQVGAGGTIQRNPMGPLADLDRLPVPAYDLISVDLASVSLDVGRGCPFKCTFCTTNDFFSKSYRVKSVARILAEMDIVHSLGGATRFGFTHDMFTLNRVFVGELCRALVAHREATGRDYRWSCSARIDCVSGELLAEMAEAGCHGIFFGIETGSQRMQTIIRKHLRVANGYTIVDRCRELGILPTTAFIAGFPEETPDDLDRTLTAAIEMTARGARPQISLLSLLPQTPLYERHHARLRFDAGVSNFSQVATIVAESGLIRQDPELFSSFYYLPVDCAERATLLRLGRVVDRLQNFQQTVRMLWPLLAEDLPRVSPIRKLAERLAHPSSEGETADEALLLIAGLSEYILAHGDYPFTAFVWDVFLAESAVALMMLRFMTRQVLSPRRGRWGKLSARFLPTDRLLAEDCWTVIHTRHELAKVRSGWARGTLAVAPPPAGSFRYLIVAASERSAGIFLIAPWQERLLSALGRGASVAELRTLAAPVAGGAAVRRLLSRLGRLGVVRSASAEAAAALEEAAPLAATG